MVDRELTAHRETIADLITLAEKLARETNSAGNFRAAEWVSYFLHRPHPALDGQRPAELMNSAHGRKLILDLMAQKHAVAHLALQ